MIKIKFRAWEKDLKKMFQSFTIIPENEKNVILMQYTGQKDKNWKEIYVWDIVNAVAKEEYEEETGISNIIQQKNWAYVVQSKPMYLNWLDLLWWWRVNIEVIWNIYENKSLFEK